MPRPRPFAALLSTALAATALVPALSAPAGAEDPGFTVQTLHFAVTTGPDDATACDIVGDLYLPSGASRTRRVPAVLTTNGFGGSKDDQATEARALAADGYAVLSYSGLGFGGSSCRITLDDPDFDGKAGSQLVSFLGGAPGIAFLDAAHTQPVAPLDKVRLDGPGDPRVGMVGGSYGGQVQFAVAGLDDRVDAIVPMITWNDLSYSLAPNNTHQTGGVSSANSGAVKLAWAAGFAARGLTGDLTNGQVPGDLLPCPNFSAWVCPALVTGGTLGYLQRGDVARLRHASVATYVERVRVPTLLVQGQADTLFNLNEAVATYRALQAQGTEVKMVWSHWGHSDSAKPGEWAYLMGRAHAWFDRHLKGRAVSTGPEFSYYRPWADTTGDAAAAYARSATFPVGTARTWRLSGANQLVTGAPAAGSFGFVTPPLGLPTALEDVDVLSAFLPDPVDPSHDVAGTFATYSTAPLPAKVDVVGSPVATLKVKAPTAALTQVLGETGQLVLFLKVQDVAPDGRTRTVRVLEAPVRVADVNRPFTVTMPAFVHRFEPGHRIRLVIGGGSPNYRGGVAAVPVTIVAGAGQTFTLPVVR